MRYVDASALLRVLFGEPGPTVPLDPRRAVVSSRLSEVECFRAVDRERLAGRMGDEETASKLKELADLLAAVDLMSVEDRVIALARDSFPVQVRAIDAIHVATAQVLAREASPEPVEFWTHDERQARAALARGLEVRGR